MQTQECQDSLTPLHAPDETLPGSGTAEQGVHRVPRHECTMHLSGRRKWSGCSDCHEAAYSCVWLACGKEAACSCCSLLHKRLQVAATCTAGTHAGQTLSFEVILHSALFCMLCLSAGKARCPEGA